MSDQVDAFKTIFISHSHVDALLVRSIDALLREMFGNAIHIACSSKPGEVDGGQAWRDWIYDRVVSSDFALVVLTPASVQSDWVLSEIGMFAAVNKLRGIHKRGALNPLIPVSFLASESDIPGPLQAHQVIRGLTGDNMRDTMTKLCYYYRDVGALDSTVTDQIVPLISDKVRQFVAAAEEALRATPLDRGEELVQEWVIRFDQLVAKGSFDEASSLRRMAQIAFAGATSNVDSVLLDFRLHRRFAELAFRMKEYDVAAQEFRLALKRAPRDIYLLRQLHRAVLDNTANPNRRKEAVEIIRRMEELDTRAIVESAELSGALARSDAEEGNFDKAVQTLKACTQYGKSAYVMIAAAIYAMLARGLTSEVLADFEATLKLIRETTEGKDFWATATELNALLALGKLGDAKVRLGEMRKYGMNDPDWDSASRYFDKILEHRRKIDQRSETARFDWRAAAGRGDTDGKSGRWKLF